MVDQPTTTERTSGARFPRRRFLRWLIRLGYGAFALAFALPALALRTLQSETQSVTAGDVLVYAAGELSGTPVTVSGIPVGSAVQAFPEGKSDNQQTLIQIVHLTGTTEPAVVAYSAICTHLGCSVLAQLTDEENIFCPCHASVFNPANDAAVVSGPAGRPLPELPLTIDSGVIIAAGSFNAPVGPQ